MPFPLLDLLISHGLTVRLLDSGRLFVSPLEGLTDELRDLIRVNKAALIAALSAPPDNDRLATLAQEHGLPLGALLDWYPPEDREALAVMPEGQVRAIVADYAQHGDRYGPGGLLEVRP